MDISYACYWVLIQPHPWPVLAYAKTLQIDNPALLAAVLVNITASGSDEIESADVSLTVGLLDTVSTSTEDLKQEDVSNNKDV